MREHDREKFVELANRRVNRALKCLHLIGNLSNRSNYDYTEEDVAAIFQALRDELKRNEERFAQSFRDPESFQLR